MARGTPATGREGDMPGGGVAEARRKSSTDQASRQTRGIAHRRHNIVSAEISASEEPCGM